ncbi:MAG: fumarylacetoacetate hydrolase family protein [Myxococcota bacterium]|nr:fumarylacetoacetate hydrolase family protein [Myxococcota bacterium]MEC9439875.1 fumarylacetoacetate hydrolase family protein [Myxococcota bacterium]
MVDIDGLANKLWEAQQTGTPCGPLTADEPELTVSQAYAIQAYNLERRDSPLLGRKIGLTSRALQEWLEVDQPDFGGLLAEMEVPLGGVVDTTKLLQPRAEAEIAFVLRDDLDFHVVTAANVLSATEYILPAIEIIDSRIADWKISYEDTIADNASSGMYVLGTKPVKLAENPFDLDLAGMVMRKNGRVVSTGAGAACMGHPVNAVVWLANTLCKLGTPLRAGDVVLSGALGPVTEVAPGDSVEADIAHVGRVHVRFA